MKYWLNLGFLEPAQMVEVAQAAERLGFEGVALPDHLFIPDRLDSSYPYSATGEISWSAEAPWPDCWISIAALSQVTHRLQFTTGVYIAPLRDVIGLAKSIATAAAFAPGRVVAGLGAGWMREEFDVVGQPFESRGGRFDEMLGLLPRLWSGDLVEHHGSHIEFPPLRMRPAASGVPIWIGGNTAPARRRAAGQDGWIGTYTDVDDVAAMVADVLARRMDVGIERPFTVALAASPGAARNAGSLDGIGVHALFVPAVALARTSDSADLITGLERFAERWMR